MHGIEFIMDDPTDPEIVTNENKALMAKIDFVIWKRGKEEHCGFAMVLGRNSMF